MKNKFTAALVRVAIFGTPLYATADRSVGRSVGSSRSASDHGEYRRRPPEVTILEEMRIWEREPLGVASGETGNLFVTFLTSPLLAATFRVHLRVNTTRKENRTH